jgi:hypothetical protein
MSMTISPDTRRSIENAVQAGGWLEKGRAG